VIAYFNSVTRIALGLGVELEPHWAEDGILEPGPGNPE
jgi:hypothetical protein